MALGIFGVIFWMPMFVFACLLAHCFSVALHVHLCGLLAP
jgi:hypothetical protein